MCWDRVTLPGWCSPASALLLHIHVVPVPCMWLCAALLRHTYPALWRDRLRGPWGRGGVGEGGGGGGAGPPPPPPHTSGGSTRSSPPREDGQEVPHVWETAGTPMTLLFGC
jgi:hypothetical protein